MKTTRKFIGLLLLTFMALHFCPLMAGEGETTNPSPVEADDLAEVAERLQLKGEKEAHFREFRYFPFRFEPVQLEGIIRISKEWGTSIEYPDKGRMVIVDPDGILLRRERENGAIEEKKMSMEKSGTASLFAALFDFNTEFLKENFALHWSETESGWKLDLIPSNGSDWKLKRIVLEGEGDQFEEIEVDFGRGRRIEIQPGEECEAEKLFGSTERQKYFRRP